MPLLPGEQIAQSSRLHGKWNKYNQEAAGVVGVVHSGDIEEDVETPAKGVIVCCPCVCFAQLLPVVVSESFSGCSRQHGRTAIYITSVPKSQQMYLPKRTIV